MLKRNRTSVMPDAISGKTFVLILMGILLIGVLIGTIAFCNMGNSEALSLSFITQGFIKNRAEQTILQTFTSSFSSAALIVIACFLGGFSAIFQPAEILIPLFRGVGLGTSIAYIYTAFGIKGFFITLIIIIPNAVISSIAIVFAARESFRMSNSIGKYLFLGQIGDIKEKISVKLYLLKFVILFVIISMSALLDSILTFVFARILFK
ncbi:MAG: hypothetical protein RR540_04020 [Oscillospiraceae bacterium]